MMFVERVLSQRSSAVTPVNFIIFEPMPSRERASFWCILNVDPKMDPARSANSLISV